MYPKWLHAGPEAHIGRPFALVRDEDEISRRVLPSGAIAAPPRGHRTLYVDTVLQADKGCDFDFMLPRARSAPTVLLEEALPAPFEGGVSLTWRE